MLQPLAVECRPGPLPSPAHALGLHRELEQACAIWSTLDPSHATCIVGVLCSSSSPPPSVAPPVHGHAHPLPCGAPHTRPVDSFSNSVCMIFEVCCVGAARFFFIACLPRHPPARLAQPHCRMHIGSAQPTTSFSAEKWLGGRRHTPAPAPTAVLARPGCAGLGLWLSLVKTLALDPDHLASLDIRRGLNVGSLGLSLMCVCSVEDAGTSACHFSFNLLACNGLPMPLYCSGPCDRMRTEWWTAWFLVIGFGTIWGATHR